MQRVSTQFPATASSMARLAREYSSAPRYSGPGSSSCSSRMSQLLTQRIVLRIILSIVERHVSFLCQDKLSNPILLLNTLPHPRLFGVRACASRHDNRKISLLLTASISQLQRSDNISRTQQRLQTQSPCLRQHRTCICSRRPASKLHLYISLVVV